MQDDDHELKSVPVEPPLQCKWTGCTGTISRDAIRAHLQTSHNVLVPGQHKKHVECHWDGCTKVTTEGTFIRHFKTHFGSFRVACKFCGLLCSRSDSALRHQSSCAEKPGKGKNKAAGADGGANGKRKKRRRMV